MSAPMLLFLAAATAVCHPVAAETVDTSPVNKVLQLLSDLQTKIIAEGKAAQITYEEFNEWCEERSRNVGFEIKTGKAEVEELKAAIEKADSSIGELNAKIEETAASIAADEADLKAATGIRKTGKADFAVREKELIDVVDTLERAITILEQRLRQGGAAMLQIQKAKSVAQALSVIVDAAMFSAKDAARLTALVQKAQASQGEDDEDTTIGAPDPAVYQSHSDDIISVLEGLLDKAKEELESTRRTEMNEQHNFEMLKQSLEDEIGYESKDLAQAKKDLAGSQQDKAVATGDLAVVTKDLEEDEATVKTLHSDCMMKAQDFEAEVKSRGEELQAISAAKDAISAAAAGANVAYGAGEAPSFLQLDGARLATGTDLANFEAVQLVRRLAEQQHSPELAQLASRMAAAIRYDAKTGEDPFAKVKALVRDMIERLLKEQSSEASHKAYCDKEMGDTNEKKMEKEATIAKLTAKIDSMTARSAQLKDETAQLQKELAELAAAQAEMDAMRQKEHQQFVAEKADLDSGLEAVKLGLKILREYYQEGDKAHAAQEGGASSVIGLLEVVESDFAKHIAEMSADESTAQAAYNRETSENKVTKARKEQDVKYKSKEATGLDSSLVEMKSDLENVQAELSAVLEYSGKLIDICVAKPESYEERAARREAEIAGLKEALEILSGDAVLVQRRAALRLRGRT